MAEENFKSLFHFEAKDFYVEFFRINEGEENEKTTIMVAKPLEDGGFTDRRSYVVDESRYGSIFKDNPSGRFLYRTVHVIPVVNEKGEPLELGIRFSVCRTGHVTIVSVVEHDLEGKATEILHEETVIHNNFLCETVTRLIENNVRTDWETGVIFEHCDHPKCFDLDVRNSGEEEEGDGDEEG